MQIAKLILQLLLLLLIVWYCNCCCFFIVNDNVIEDRYTFFSKLCNCLLIDLFTTSNSYSSKTGVSSFTVVYLLCYKLPHFYFKNLATMNNTRPSDSCYFEVFEKLTHACYIQIALETMLLPIHISFNLR
jgi:hypothetical protein